MQIYIRHFLNIPILKALPNFIVYNGRLKENKFTNIIELIPE